MGTIGILERASSEGWTDQEVIERVKAGDSALYEIIMRRYNQRLYRVTRAILRDDSEAEASVAGLRRLGNFSSLLQTKHHTLDPRVRATVYRHLD